jgi:hypothetical protein
MFDSLSILNHICLIHLGLTQLFTPLKVIVPPPFLQMHFDSDNEGLGEVGRGLILSMGILDPGSDPEIQIAVPASELIAFLEKSNAGV